MTRFIALLALVSGLLLVDGVGLDAKADDRKEHCNRPASDAMLIVDQMKAQGFKLVELNAKEAVSYLVVIREVADVPEFPGVTLSIIYNEDVAAVALVINGDTACGLVRVSWPLHVRALKAAKGVSI